MTGHSFKECDSIMRSPFLNTVAKMSKGFAMSGIHHKITSKNIFKFMTLDGNLPSINSKSLRIILGRFPSKGLNQCLFWKKIIEYLNVQREGIETFFHLINEFSLIIGNIENIIIKNVEKIIN